MAQNNLSFMLLLLIITTSSTNAFKCEGLDSEVSINDKECDKKHRYSIDLNACNEVLPNKDSGKNEENDFETPEFPDYSDDGDDKVVFPGLKYTKAKFDAGCCTSSGTFHRRCICNEVAEVHSCRSICNADSQCKGYAIYQNKSCQIATTSNCPSNCKGPYQETNTQKLDYNSRCSLGGWSGGCAIKDEQSQIRSGENNIIDWKANFENNGDNKIHTTENLLKRGKDNGTLSLLKLSNNKKINRGTPSKRKQKQHSNNQEQNQEQFDLIKGNKEGKASVNKLEDSKSNQKPPSSIQLRRKVHVEGRRCKEIEILRKIKASIEIVKGYENQSMFLICQEIKLEKSIGLERSKEKLFDICYCKENNKNCMKKASQLSYNVIEKELSKFDATTNKSPMQENAANHGYVDMKVFLLILIIDQLFSSYDLASMYF